MSKECIFHETRLPERLKQLRGITSQQKLSAVLGVKQTTYSTWETGRNEPPLFILATIARQFSVTTDWLLGIDDAAPASVPAPAVEQTGDVARLWSLIESQQRTIEALAKGGAASVAQVASSAGSQGREASA